MGGIVQRNSRDPYEGYEVFKKYRFSGIKLGIGETCQVHEAYLSKDEREEQMFAVKIIVKDEVEVAGRDLSEIFKEVQILQKIRYPNICKFYEKFEDKSLIYLVYESCEGGTLFEKLEDDAVLEEKVAKPMVLDMFCAVSYLHDKGYIHRDLRPENWMLETNGDEITPGKLKLTHFKLAMQCGKDTILSQPCGTLHYVAPEMLRGNYGLASDVWTLGVLVFLMLYGSYPFDGDSSTAVMTSILASEADWSNSCYALSTDAKDLLKLFFIKDPTKRITVCETLKHPWLPQRRGSERPSILAKMLGGHSDSVTRTSRRSSGGDSLHTPRLRQSISTELKGSDGKRRQSALVTRDLLSTAGEAFAQLLEKDEKKTLTRSKTQG